MSRINNYQYIPACPDQVDTLSTYTLLNRQQPIHARISTNNERDRRPIDPPPIIQIKLNNATPQQTDAFHQSSYFFMCANLIHPTNDEEIYTPTHNALSGQTVSSMYKLKDINNHDGAFFIFGDLSVKVEGHFRLKLSLFEITSTGPVCIQSTFTSPFIVYASKKFPGMLDSTFLSRSFSDQGARIRIRKENRSAQTNNNSTLSPVNRKRKMEIQTTLVPTEYCEQRRSSVTSSGTESSSESQPSPVISLPPLSPPFVQDISFFGSLPDLTVKLPPIFHEPKKPKTSPIEQDAVFAMIQLAHPHPPAKKLLFI